VIDTAFSAAGASPQTGHIRFRTGFIREYELVDGQRALGLFPSFAGGRNIGPLLFTRV